MFTFTVLKKTYNAATLAEASALFSAARDKSGRGMRSFPDAIVSGTDGSEHRISYNGKVWASLIWTPGEEPVYSPYN